jgi:hypothetical protein
MRSIESDKTMYDMLVNLIETAVLVFIVFLALRCVFGKETK